MPSTYYYNLVPLVNLPLSSPQKYTYSTNKPIQLGREVRVKFGNRETRAIVWEKIKEKPSFRTLKINQTINSLEVLNRKQRMLAEWISRSYWTSLGATAKMMAVSYSVKFFKKYKAQKASQLKIQSSKVQLTLFQKKAVKKIAQSFLKNQTYLLHGATGSGKTEVYLQAIEKLLYRVPNTQVIVLVPEISLTPQAWERYAQKFPDSAAILHSRLTQKERFLQWLKIKNNQARIIIGPRSALFAPIENLGLIIIDEEHDPSFKQGDQAPRYETCKTAEKLASLHSCPLILGSATPSIESYYQTQNKSLTQFRKKYTLLQLPYRISQTQKTKPSPLPRVKIIDMRQELKRGNFSIFSALLQEKIKYTLLNKRQILLFLNRRGTASFVLCRECGWVAKCKRCDVPLVYHFPLYSQKIQERMVCHHCGLTSAPPHQCAQCQSKYVKYLGLGTQRVETELSNLFPQAKISRMDRDTTRFKNAHQKIYSSFKNHKIDILIGTQMITKGWDLPQVDLVGILAADIGLHLPDFRASERVFQVLTQAAGRSGRGKKQGEVILQTYSPAHFAIQQAAQHNYKNFYKLEIQKRKTLKYPPFSKLIKLVFQNPKLCYTKQEAQKTARLLKTTIAKNKLKISLLGPSPMFIPRLRGKWRYQIILKIDPYLSQSNYQKLLEELPQKWKIDIDPENLL